MWLHGLLFLLTIVTTTLVGADQYAGFLADFKQPGPLPMSVSSLLLRGLWYSGTILGILGCHELGHYFACRYYDVDASLPYFLPVPISITGTLGAFIRIREPIPQKRMLFDIGIAGPIAGFLVAVPALFFGVAMSHVVPLPANFVGYELGEPLLFKLSSQLIWGTIPEGYSLNMHPVAFAAWFGLLATAWNLIPAGQLDGGHIAYSVLGRRSTYLTFVMIACGAALSFVSTNWIAWTVLMIVMLAAFGPRHPPTIDEHVPLDRTRTILAVVAFAMFALSFTPVPIAEFIGKTRVQEVQRFKGFKRFEPLEPLEPLKNADRIDVDDHAPLKLRPGGNRGENDLAHALAIRALDEELRPVLAAQLAERRRRRPEHPKARALGVPPQPLRDSRRIVHGAGERPRADHRVDHRHERRVTHLAAKIELALEKRRVVLPARRPHAVVVRIERLHDGFTGLVAAAGPADHLREQLKRPLRGPKVGEAEADVRRDDAHQRHAREVVALGDHLGADEHVDLAGQESPEQRRQRAFAADGVAIETRDPGARAGTPHFDLDALGAEARLIEIRPGAEQTGGGDARRVVAIVAAGPA